jgi:hypothetical protein
MSKLGDHLDFGPGDVLFRPPQAQMIAHAQHSGSDLLDDTRGVVPIADQRPFNLVLRIASDSIHLNAKKPVTEHSLTFSRVEKNSELQSFGITIAGCVKVQPGSVIVEAHHAPNGVLTTVARSASPGPDAGVTGPASGNHHN